MRIFMLPRCHDWGVCVNNTQSAQEVQKHAVELLDGLWEEALRIMQDFSEEQRGRLFREALPQGIENHCFTEAIQGFCRFWDDASWQFSQLTDVGQETWLQEARNCGPVEARFADILQGLHWHDTHSKSIHGPHQDSASGPSKWRDP